MTNKRTGKLKDILQEKEKEIAKLHSLIRVSQIITSSLERESVIKSVIELARDMLQSQAASLFLIDESSEELVFDFSTDIDSYRTREIRIPLGKGIAGHVAKTGKSVNIENVIEDSRWYAEVDQKSGFKTRSLLCVPLKFQDKIIGTVQVLNKLENAKFSHFDRQLLEAFAAQAAIAIQNARLYENLQTAYQLLNEENISLKKSIGKVYQFDNIIGKSSQMQKIFQIIEKIKDTPTTILIQGETGTGKELIAKTIHYTSVRKNNRFVAINCSALPEQLLESELFGHKRGAFTGAVFDKPGLFETAHGGTVFLDEIGDISPNLQAKLLRVLQENEIRRLGETKTRKIDVRVISATHHDLKQEIEQGKFREDLYYRLKVITLELPPLRDRKEDIPLLITHFIKKYSEIIGKKVNGISLDAANLLQRYSWPGNIRELEHEIERAITLMDDGEKITPQLLSEEIIHSDIYPAIGISPENKTLKEIVGDFEAKLISEQLKKRGGNVTKAARRFGLSRQALIKKMAKYKIKRLS